MKHFILFSITLLFSAITYGQQLHYKHKDLPCYQKKFNVHVHIILDSLQNSTVTRSQIDAVFEEATSKFSPICLSFEVCKVDTIKNYNFDSIPKAKEYFEVHTKFSSDKRINVYILTNTFIEKNMSIQKICGLAGESIYISKNCMGALTHELGHFFGLAHTFEGEGKELVNGSNCLTEGDRICDTPADPYIQFADIKHYIKDCEFINNQTDANGEYYQPHLGNIMSYYDCPCQQFSRGQFLKMGENYLANFKDFW